MVSDVQSHLDPSFGKATSFHDGLQTSERVRVLSASQATSADLTVLTAEGDTVTISAQSESDLTYGDYRFRSRGENGMTVVRAQVAAFSLSQSLEISVEGDLNEEELGDIKRLVDTIKNVIRKFLKGDFEGAFHKAVRVVNRFGQLDSLAGFQLAVETSQTVAVAQQQRVGTQLPSDTAVPSEIQLLPGSQSPDTEVPSDVSQVVDAAVVNDVRGDGDATKKTQEQQNVLEPFSPAPPPDKQEGASVPSNPANAAAGASVGGVAEDDDDADSTGAATENSTESPFTALVDRVVQHIGDAEAKNPRLGEFIPKIVQSAARDLQQDSRVQAQQSVLERIQQEILLRFAERQSSDSGAHFQFQLTHSEERSFSFSLTV